MTAIDEIKVENMKNITRPYRVIGMITTDAEYNYMCSLVIEYLDVYEYDREFIWKLDEKIAQGWGVWEYYTDADNEPCAVLRRVKQTESANHDD